MPAIEQGLGWGVYGVDDESGKRHLRLSMDLENKLKYYYITAILGVVFAIVGFSYNAWRLEVSEENDNIRTAAFKVLTELAQLEQIIYSAHYDQDQVEGNPRKGWVKIGLVYDLSSLISTPVEEKAASLKDLWGSNWAEIANSRSATDKLVESIDAVRVEIKKEIKSLD